ncbi:MAG: hypothetical protein HQ481_07995 [Alphaproteobacteria bacterium]|nr:hypothetical protein [Alphaproteobacteria bacterium]
MTWTLFLLAASVGLIALSRWGQRRPRETFEAPLIPWTTLQVMAVILFILLAAHLVSLVTGQPFKGRLG